MDPLLLLPPSEGKEPGGSRRRTPDRFGPSLGVARRAVLDALAVELEQSAPARLESILNAKGPLLERAIESTRLLIEGRAPMLPAWRRYRGVVYAHLLAAELAPSERARILVPSAIYGITTLEDAVADYRLKMTVALAGVGNLARFWRDALATTLEERRPKRTLIDLLPAEHSRSIDWGRLGDVVHVRFASFDGERAIGHDAKAVKGRFARYLIEVGLEQAEGFRFQGWTTSVCSDGFVLTEPPTRRWE